jgi:dienelactone hydrolase
VQESSCPIYSSGTHLLQGTFASDTFFDRKPFPLDQHPPKTDEHKVHGILLTNSGSIDIGTQQNMQTFFQTKAHPPTVLPGLINLAKLLRDGGVTKLYLYGLCWGGKMATLSGCQSINVDGKSIPAFDAVAGLHPA